MHNQTSRSFGFPRLQRSDDLRYKWPSDTYGATAEASLNTPRCCFAVDNQNSSERVQAVVVIYATASSFWVVHRGGPRGWMLKQVRDWLIYTCAHISTGGINKWNWGSHIWQKQMCYLSLALEASGRNRTATRMCVSKLHTLAQLCFCKRFQLQTWNVFWCWLFHCFTWSQVCSSHTAFTVWGSVLQNSYTAFNIISF